MKVKLAVLDLGPRGGVSSLLFHNWKRVRQESVLLSDFKIFFHDRDFQYQNQPHKKLFRRHRDFTDMSHMFQDRYWRVNCPVDVPRSIIMTTRESLPSRGEDHRDMCLLTTTFCLRETANEAEKRSVAYVRYLVITLGETCPEEELPKKHPMQLQTWMLNRKEYLAIEVDCEIKDRNNMKRKIGAFIRDVEEFNGPVFFDELKDSSFDEERTHWFIKSFRNVDTVLRRSQDMMNQVGRSGISTVVGFDLIKQYDFPLYQFFEKWEGAARTSIGAHPFNCLVQA